MSGVELVCFNMISYCGAAKSSFIESLDALRNGHYDEAKHLIDDGSMNLIEGHKAHAELLTLDVNGSIDCVSILMIHAEDQLMSAETLKIMAEAFLDTSRK